ncbi:MAG: hypothetical protein F4059_03670 [Gemmatimonadetes bacterium]|nr:hypothetical protein [Gemmatimonadota bacterium]
MDWWQTVSLMATLVLTGTAVATFGWRVLRRETDKLREENRHAHNRIGAEIGQVRGEMLQIRDDLRGEIGQFRDDLRGEMVQFRDDLRGEMVQMRDDLRGEIGQVRRDLYGEIVQLRNGQASLLEGQASLREGLGEVRGELRGLTQSMQTLQDDFRAHVMAGTD